MRLSVFDRLLLFLSMIFMLVIGIGVAVVSTGAMSFSKMAKIAEFYLSDKPGTLLLVAIAAILILVAVKLILALFTSPKEKTKTEASEKIVLKSSDDGNIMVSSDLVKDIAIRKSKSYDDIKDVDCKIVCQQDGVKVLLKFYLKRDIEINDFLAKAREELKEYVSKYSGVDVLCVDICADVVNSNSRIR